MALTESDTKFLRDVAAHCEPFQPLETNSSLYVPFDSIQDAESHSVRGEDLAKALAGHITMCKGSATTQLFAGFRGSGKSTELRRCRTRLEQAGFDVLLQDAEAYTNLTTPIDIGDFLLSLALALEDGVQLLVPHETLPGHSLSERVKEFFKRRQVEIDGFDIGLDAKIFKANLKGRLQRDPGFRDRIQKHLSKLVYEFHEEFIDFVTDLVLWLREKRGERRGLVLILDGIDHVRGVGDQRQNVQSSIEALFGQFGSFLNIPLVHTIYTVPTYLPFLNPALRDQFGVASVKLLAMTKTHGCTPGRPDYPEGQQALRDFLVKRCIDPERLFGPAWQDPLNLIVRECGGYLRDMLSIVRGAVERAWAKDVLPATAQFVEQARNNLKDEYRRAMTPEDAAALRSIAQTFSVDHIPEAYRPRLADLFELHVALCYTNDREWYDIHPLLHERVMAQTP